MPQVMVSLQGGLSTNQRKRQRHRKKMYRNCDGCRISKKACDAEYSSIQEALANSIACSNCKKKGHRCSFNFLLSSAGHVGVPALTLSYRNDQVDTQGANTTRQSIAFSEITPSTEFSKTIPSTGFPKAIPLTEFSETIPSTLFSTSPPSNPPSSFYPSSSSVPFSVSPNITFSSPEPRFADDMDRLFLDREFNIIYQETAEQSFRCWLSRLTTPYVLDLDDVRDPWNNRSLLWKVCALDRGAQRFKPLATYPTTDKNISRALNAVMRAFASQWPQYRTGLASHKDSGPYQSDQTRIRLGLWESARDQLMDVVDHSSFRVVYALILFSWTEKPVPDICHDHCHLNHVPTSSSTPFHRGSRTAASASAAINPHPRCERTETSTMMLASAARKLLSIRWQIQDFGRQGIDPWSQTTSRSSSSIETIPEHKRLQNVQVANLLEKTYYTLFWLGVMIDTETAVLRKYPPVMSDEDTDLLQLPLFHPLGSLQVERFSAHSTSSRPPNHRFKLWDELILNLSQQRNHLFARSWPTSENQARLTLSSSATVKVLLFRIVSRLQLACWRKDEAEKVQAQIQRGFNVIHHWKEVYHPFFESCLRNYSSLPAAIRSWYVCIVAPWNQAVLLFLELLEDIHQEELMGNLGGVYHGEDAASTELMRQEACSQLATLSQMIQEVEIRQPNASSPSQYTCQSTHSTTITTTMGATILLSDPWAEILVLSFSVAARSDLKILSTLEEEARWLELGSAKSRINQCLWALRELSGRSGIAVVAYNEILQVARFNNRTPQVAVSRQPIQSCSSEYRNTNENYLRNPTALAMEDHQTTIEPVSTVNLHLLPTSWNDRTCYVNNGPSDLDWQQTYPQTSWIFGSSLSIPETSTNLSDQDSYFGSSRLMAPAPDTTLYSSTYSSPSIDTRETETGPYSTPETSTSSSCVSTYNFCDHNNDREVGSREQPRLTTCIESKSNLMGNASLFPAQPVHPTDHHLFSTASSSGSKDLDLLLSSFSSTSAQVHQQ